MRTTPIFSTAAESTPSVVGEWYPVAFIGWISVFVLIQSCWCPIWHAAIASISVSLENPMVPWIHIFPDEIHIFSGSSGRLHRTFFMGTPCSSQPKRSNLTNSEGFYPVSIKWVTPIAGWFTREKSHRSKCMMTGGKPYLGNHDTNWCGKPTIWRWFSKETMRFPHSSLPHPTESPEKTDAKKYIPNLR